MLKTKKRLSLLLVLSLMITLLAACGGVQRPIRQETKVQKKRRMGKERPERSWRR